MSDLPLIISEFGFLRGGTAEKSEDWEDTFRVLDTALRPWGDFRPKSKGVETPTLFFGTVESSVLEAKSVVRAEIEAAISQGVIAIEIEEDMQLSIKPKDLRSFMLLDASQAILTQAEYTQCSNCGNAFRARDNRQRSYCHIGCRNTLNQKNYMKRKSQKDIAQK